jgi:hypothetical protein
MVRMTVSVPGVAAVHRTLEQPLNQPHVWIRSAGWALCATAVFVSIGSLAPASFAILAVCALVPPYVYASLSGGPAVTIAEVLYNTEQQP